jgi:GST-like protein
VVDEYSIADMAVWPWLPSRKLQGISLEDFPNVARWNDKMKVRPGVRRGYDLLIEQQSRQKPSGEQWDQLFGARLFGGRGAN